MLTEKHLASFNITLQQAYDFIVANINQPEVIFDSARQFGVTSRMLSEITGVPINTVHGYFLTAGYSNAAIGTQLDTSILVNSDLGELEELVSFNHRTGVLSNTALRKVVEPVINEDFSYELSFGPVKAQQSEDHLYSSGELGVSNLDNIPATNENIESLFYGSLIKVFLTMDEDEMNQINLFSGNEDSDAFQALLVSALHETPEPIVWSEEQLAGMVTTEAIRILGEYWTHNSVGILDHSYLSLAVAS